jgi:hypothetical protein
MKLPKFVPEIVLGAGTAVEVSSAISQFFDFADSGKTRAIVWGIAVVAAVLAVSAGVVIINRLRRRDAAKAEKAEIENEGTPAGDSPAPRQRRGALWWFATSAITVTCASIIVIAVSAFQTSTGTEHEPSPPPPSPTTHPPTSSSFTSPPPPTKPSTPAAAFTKPAEGAPIRVRSSVAVAGTADHLGENNLWLMTKPDAGGGGYYFTGSSPVTTRDGAWQFLDTEVGDETDIGKNVTYVAILADTACSSYLTTNSVNDSVDNLTAGCSEIASVAVRATK